MRDTVFIGIACLGLIGCGGGGDERAARPAEVTAGAEQPRTPSDRAGIDEPRAMAEGSQSTAMHEESCPMQVPGVELVAEDIEAGVALIFTTSEPDEVVELRRRVRAMAPIHAQAPASAEGVVMRPPAELNVVDVPGGARLDLRALDPHDVDSLRRQGRMRADLLIRGACPLIPPQQA